MLGFVGQTLLNSSFQQESSPGLAGKASWVSNLLSACSRFEYLEVVSKGQKLSVCWAAATMQYTEIVFAEIWGV